MISSQKLFIIILSITLSLGCVQSQNLITNSGFEGGTVSPWYAWCDIETVTTNPHSGTYCARVYNRTEYWDSPVHSINTLMVDGTYYKLTAWVRASGEPESEIEMTIAQNDGAGQNYYFLNMQTVTEGYWKQLTGHFQLEQEGTLTSLYVYFQGPPAGVEIFLDDVVIEEVDYNWLTDANAGIETNRKRDTRVLVVDEDGDPLPGASVHLQQTSHDFAFGACVNDNLISNSDYKDFFVSHYEWGVHEAHAKWPQMEATQDNLYYGSVDGQYDICVANGIKMRGHNVFWCFEQYVPTWVPALSNTELEAEMLERIDDVVGHFADNGRKMYHWDVNNEMLYGSYFMDRYADTIRPWMFEKVHEADTATELFVNDYGILNGRKVYQYIDQIQDLIDDGAPIHGIGVQSHMGQKINPYSIKYNLDLLSDFDLPILSTEFDVEFADENIRADRLERFFRVVFGHPNTSGIFMWGFWENSHWKDNAHIVNSNWTLNAAGQKFEHLMDLWTSDTTIVADANGEISCRVFHGEYSISVTPASGPAFVATGEVLPGIGEKQLRAAPPAPCSGTAWNTYQDNKFNELPTTSIEVLADHFNDFSHSDYDNDATYTTVAITGQTFNEALQVSIDTEPSRSDRVNMTLGAPSDLDQDDVILVSFYARTIVPASSGMGEIEFRFMRASAPWTKFVSWPMTIGTEWKRYYVPFPVEVWRGMGSEEAAPEPPQGYDDDTFAPNEVRFRLCLGYYPQTLQIADIRLVNYGPSLSGDLLPHNCIDDSDTRVLIKKSDGSGEQCTPQILADAEEGTKYLPDFSYAGYHFSEEALPTGSAGMTVLNVTSYGAVANDGNDDTTPIQNAITAAEGTSGPVVLEFPAGTFKVSEIMFLKRDDFIVRGAGSGTGGTVLEFTQAMEYMTKPQEILDQEQEIVNNNMKTDAGEWYSPFSWIGGVIWIKNTNPVPAGNLATITSATLRGAHTVTVDNTSSLSIGKRLELRYYEDGSSTSVREHVFNCTAANLPDGFGSGLPPTWSGGPDVWQVVTIESINGNNVTFKEALNHNIHSEWEGQLRDVSFVEEVGFEGFKIEFPFVDYAGHHIEEGFNGIYIDDAINSWVRDVEIVNCDAGIMVDNSKNITVKDVEISGRGGHYTFKMGSGDQILFSNFTVSAKAIHNPSFNTYCRTGVYTNGTVDFVRMDQHNGMNHQNLYDKLTLTGDVRHLWSHGGNDGVRPTHAAFNTSWNLMFQPDQDVPVHGTNILDGPSAYLIGLTSDATMLFDYGPNVCAECFGEGTMTVPSLFDYQLNRRLSLIISEIADPSDNTNARFVELYNIGSDNINFETTKWYLCKQIDGSSWQDIQLSGQVTMGETFIISYGSDFTNFYNAFGFHPDMVSEHITGDGDDGYYLYLGGDHTT
ncbi:MAG: endo-1,4-beta-xylanase, partial [Bacteroidota bacterium]|nr:endo-1,4-beta-xylanase [Bacteroidota bacterium]